MKNVNMNIAELTSVPLLRAQPDTPMTLGKSVGIRLRLLFNCDDCP